MLCYEQSDRQTSRVDLVHACVQERFPAPAQVSVAEGSSLVVAGDATIEHLDVEGALVVLVEPGASLTIRSLVVRNSGWKVVRPTSCEVALRLA